MLTAEEKKITRASLEMALEAGASKARASLSKNTMSIVATLDGEVDKVTGCLDRSISLNLFVDGRYGTFSTNKLDEKSLRAFIGKAAATTRMLSEDACRDLPDPARTAKDASGGNELGICDPAWDSATPDQRIAFALNNGVKTKSGKGWKLISEEGEYSDSQYFNYVVDTQGLEVLHSETSFEFFTELTIQDSKGRKYSGGWWEAAPLLRDFHPEKVAPAALQEAVMQIGPKSCPGGKYRAVIDSEVSQKLLNPILNALNAFNIQQKNSFLDGTLGKQVFPAGFNLMDMPRIPGEACGKMFDSEGVATTNHYIIKDGVVQEYFINTYMANKLGIPPTVEDATRPYIPVVIGDTLRSGAGSAGIPPIASDGPLPLTVPRVACLPEGIPITTVKQGDVPYHTVTRESIMALCGDGILVTDFCGGNSNPATGDFSYAIQGYRFKGGRIVHPVREMLITGNIVTLWSNLIAAGDDARRCRAKLTPTLAFDNVDFSG